MADKDGGAAFPISVQPDFQFAEPGMSLRDWFAGQAAAALVKRCISADDWRRIGQVSYEVADALIAARQDTD